MSLIRLNDRGTTLAWWIHSGPIPWCPSINMVPGAPAAELVPYLDSETLDVVYQMVTAWEPPAYASSDPAATLGAWHNKYVPSTLNVLRIDSHVQAAPIDPMLLIQVLRKERRSSELLREECDQMCEENAHLTRQLETVRRDCIPVTHGLEQIRPWLNQLGITVLRGMSCTQKRDSIRGDSFELNLILEGYTSKGFEP